MIRAAIFLGIAGLAGLYTLLFGEVFLRVMDPQPLMPRYVTGTDWGIRGNEPGISYRHWTPETEVMITINSQGMRDAREHAFEAPAGTCRAALMGDSYFMGYEASFEDSIAGQLEALFEQAGYDLDVLNFAVSGHGTSEMILHFENLASRFSPDITVFQFHGSDYSDNIRAGLHRLTSQGAVEITGQSYLPAVGIRNRLEAIPAWRWMSGNSQIYSGLREKAAVYAKKLLAGANLRARAARPENADGQGDFQSRPAQRLTAALITEARRVTEAAGSDWYLFNVPNRRSRTEFISMLGRMDLAPGEQARTVAVLPAFTARAAEDTKLYYEKAHLHFTPLGNQIAATALFERISRDSAGVLAKCKTAPGGDH
jgi:hypothetical protein